MNLHLKMKKTKGHMIEADQIGLSLDLPFVLHLLEENG